MVLSKRISRSCIYLGCIQLIAGTAGVACGAVTKSKLTGPVGATIGLWAVYFMVLGAISIAVGVFKASKILCFVFIFQVIGLIIAATGVIISALFWAFLNTCSSIVPVGSEVLDINVCACGVAADLTGYDVSCSDLRVVRNISAAATFVYVILGMTSFIGIIFSCIGMCCSAKEPRSVNVTTTTSPSTPQPESKPMIMGKLFSQKSEPEEKNKKKTKRMK